MVQRRRNADVNHINVFPGQKRIEVVGGKPDSEFARKRAAAFPGSGANAPDLHDVARQLGVIRQMHPRPVTRARQSNAECLHLCLNSYTYFARLAQCCSGFTDFTESGFGLFNNY